MRLIKIVTIHNYCCRKSIRDCGLFQKEFVQSSDVLNSFWQQLSHNIPKWKIVNENLKKTTNIEMFCLNISENFPVSNSATFIKEKLYHADWRSGTQIILSCSNFFFEKQCYVFFMAHSSSYTKLPLKSSFSFIMFHALCWIDIEQVAWEFMV